MPKRYTGPAGSYPECRDYLIVQDTPFTPIPYVEALLLLHPFTVLLPVRVFILLRKDNDAGEAVVAYTVPYVVRAYSNPMVCNGDLGLLDLTC